MPRDAADAKAEAKSHDDNADAKASAKAESKSGSSSSSGGGGGGGAESKSGGGALSQAEARALIAKVAGAYFDDEELQERLEGWASQNCRRYEVSEDGEHPLSHSALHSEFCDAVELEMEDVIGRAGSTTGEFFKLVAQDDSKDMYGGMCLAGVLTALTTFEAFCACMVDAQEGNVAFGMPPLVNMETGALEF